jgi:cell division protein FtsB
VATDPETPRGPRRAVTGRAIVLGTLVVLLLVLLASPLNRYFGSRSALSGASTQLQHDREQLAKLKKQVALWSDPGFIQRQARTRLQYAMPGDTVYVVVGHGQQNEIAKTARIAGRPPAADSWNTKLWDSVARADAAP